MNGIINTGFKIIGAPNNNGSFTAKVVGINDALPTAFVLGIYIAA